MKAKKSYVQEWLRSAESQAQMSMKAMAKVYGGRKVVQTLRKLNNCVSGLGKDELQKVKTDLSKGIVMTMDNDKREQVREVVDLVIHSDEQLKEHEFTWLIFHMGSLLLQPEEENTEDPGRFRQLCVMYDDLQKRITKLKIKCPGCGRSLKGVTRAMIGDVGVCPKCKVEFIIEPKDEQKQSERETL